jgi:hypothetical protein
MVLVAKANIAFITPFPLNIQCIEPKDFDGKYE